MKTDKNKTYYESKRKAVLETIKPICDAFGIADYDYILNDKYGRLVIEGQHIGRCCNSISAIVRELITYLFVCAFETQTLNQLKQYGIEQKNEDE